ncbi:MAG: transposase, partial [Actinobacteria bacterium]|nr:transposase [Actinomycetota bacterium]
MAGGRRAGRGAAHPLSAGKANTQRGVIRFVDELIARVRAAGATGPILLRADSGFHNKALRARLAAKGVAYSIGARVTKRVAGAITQIADEHWQTLTDYPASGQAQIAETTLDGERLIVRRVRPLSPDAQGHLFTTCQHHALISNRSDALAVVEAEHRAHAVVELAIRDVKDQALAHFPCGQFAANAAWT